MKHLRFLCLAATAVTLVSACDLISNPDTPHTVSLPAPAYKAEAKKYVALAPGSSSIRSVAETESVFKTIELTESGKYIVHQKMNPKHQSIEDETFYVGEFSGKDGQYTLNGFGKLKVAALRSDSSVHLTVTLSDGTVIDFDAETSENKPLQGAFADNLCRTWIPKETLIQVMGSEVSTSLGVGRVFNGCDIPGMVAYLNENGIHTTETLEGYKVTSVSLTAEKTILVQFDGQKPYVGNWLPNLENGSFTYELEAGKGNELINGTGDGSVSFNNNDDLKLVLNAVVKSGSKNYAAKSTIVLSCVK